MQDKQLQLYDFEGVKQREWSMDAVIRYIKVGQMQESFLAGNTQSMLSCADHGSTKHP